MWPERAADCAAMSILASDFSGLVVVPALELLAPAGIPYSKTAHDLLMGTAAQESLLGTYLVQQSGPGVGVFMVTPNLVAAVLMRCSLDVRSAIGAVGDVASSGAIASNLTLAAMIARCWYWVVPDALPPDTVSGLWGYYKRWYNTPAGAATETEWSTNWGLTGISLPA